MTKIIKDSDNNQNRDYLLQDNKKTMFGIRFIVITLVILIIAVVATAFYLDWF